MRSGSAGTPLPFKFPDFPAITPVIAASVLILAVSFISFANSIKKPFTLDEVEEARMARKITEMGPRTFHPAPEGGGEDLSHPLLYSYTNAVFYRLFGSSEPALRSYGIFFFVLSLIILLLMTGRRYSENTDRGAALFVAASLYLLNPLLIQHSMLLNADNNISAFAILLFIYLFVRFEGLEDRDFIRSRLLLAAAVAFNYMCKEITPTFMLASVVIYRLLNREWKRLLLDCVLVIGLGLAIFWAVWYAYCKLTATDVLAFIKFTAARKTKKVTLEFLIRSLKYFFVSLKWPFYWVSAPFFALVVLSAMERVKGFVKRRRLAADDFVLLAGLCMFMPFVFVKASIDMMKYQYPAVPLFIYCIAVLFSDRAWPALKKGADNAKLFLMAIAASAALASVYYRMGDYILVLWGQMSRHMAGRFYPYYFGPILLCMVLSVFFLRRRGMYAAAIGALVMMIYPVNTGLNLNQTAEYTTAECWLNYGESGLKDTVAYLRERTNGSSLVVARKDIEYYLTYRGEGEPPSVSMPYAIYLTADEKVLRAYFEATPIDYFVFERVSAIQHARKDVFQIINEYFYVDQQCGSFVIMRKRRR